MLWFAKLNASAASVGWRNGTPDIRLSTVCGWVRRQKIQFIPIVDGGL